MLLFANYAFFVELRRKSREIFDRVVHIIVPLGAIAADLFLLIANRTVVEPNHFDLSFHLRQASAGLILLVLVYTYYAVWYFSVPHARVLHVLLLLAVSSTCVLIQAIYVQTSSVPSLFIELDQSEVYFYSGHIVPLFLLVSLGHYFIHHDCYQHHNQLFLIMKLEKKYFHYHQRSIHTMKYTLQWYSNA